MARKAQSEAEKAVLDYTPGPWEAIELNKGEALIVQPTDKTLPPICLVDRQPNAWANSRIIAVAPLAVALAEEIVNHLYEKQDIYRVRAMAQEFLAKAGQA